MSKIDRWVEKWLLPGRGRESIRHGWFSILGSPVGGGLIFWLHDDSMGVAVGSGMLGSGGFYIWRGYENLRQDARDGQ